jgi:hypothetical protein
MKKFLNDVKNGEHVHCKYCPWNPQKVGLIAFGLSCEDHGINWSQAENAISMQIVQDPAGTTPGKTGRLCFVHNSKNPSDKTAQHAYDLWKTTVSFDNYENVDPYLKKHYWTNALLHGADKVTQKELRKTPVLETARHCCANVLNEQIKLLSPKVIIVNGEYAAKSLFELGYLSIKWNEIKQTFSQSVYRETKQLPSGESTTVFCTYHTAITPVNTHIARLYSNDIQSQLDERLKEIITYPKVISFLKKYPSNDPNKPGGRGMRVLLLHWLDIGKAIRFASDINHQNKG